MVIQQEVRAGQCGMTDFTMKADRRNGHRLTVHDDFQIIEFGEPCLAGMIFSWIQSQGAARVASCGWRWHVVPACPARGRVFRGSRRMESEVNLEVFLPAMQHRSIARKQQRKQPQGKGLQPSFHVPRKTHRNPK
ncbi:MAG: hypothetical protein CMO80_19510 [Verrucomicrobiales bacterium]|nr:hypothetical protein [Verrucomicrobiales bacterium]|tara:strand:- start:5777 stop:6181 length:405 start_codon:yes stop_codon:yes gene_type:complete